MLRKTKIGLVCACAIVLMSLASCDLLNALDPLVGTWKATVFGFVVSYTFEADKSFTMSANPGGSRGGTWKKTSSQITMTFSDEDVLVWNYQMASDNKSMTISTAASSLAFNLAKQ